MKLTQYINGLIQDKGLKMLLLVCIFSVYSCKKLVDVKPPSNQLTSGNVFKDNSTAAAVLTGVYNRMSGYSFATGAASLSLRGGLSADELTLWDGANNPELSQYYRNALLSTNPTFWSELFNYVHTTNVTLEKITASPNLTPAVARQLIGEAKFIRAFCNFYLVNLFGDVPIVLTSDYKINNAIARSSQDKVYQQIVADLKDARDLLSENYRAADAISPTQERVRPTKWAATAMLARVYLYIGKWAEAEEEASALINNTQLFTLTPALKDVFLANSSETIWQLMPVDPNLNTADGNVFILTAGPNEWANYVFLSNQVLAAFEDGDHRRSEWVGVDSSTGTQYYYPLKYKIAFGRPLVEYLMVLRLTEQYMIRAEARTEQGKISEAAADLNIVRNRAELPGTTATTNDQLRAAIAHERQVEFFTEWGHRWFDLKRTGGISAIMRTVTPAKGGAWNDNRQWFPLWLDDLKADPNLDQNPGY